MAASKGLTEIYLEKKDFNLNNCIIKDATNCET